MKIINKQSGLEIDLIQVSHRIKKLIGEGALISAAYYLYRFGFDVKTEIDELVKMEEDTRENIMNGKELNFKERIDKSNEISKILMEIVNDLTK